MQPEVSLRGTCVGQVLGPLCHFLSGFLYPPCLLSCFIPLGPLSSCFPLYMHLADSWLTWLAPGPEEVIYPGYQIHPNQAADWVLSINWHPR